VILNGPKLHQGHINLYSLRRLSIRSLIVSFWGGAKQPMRAVDKGCRSVLSLSETRRRVYIEKEGSTGQPEHRLRQAADHKREGAPGVKVLVTGGAGFIGSVLTQLLIDEGRHSVRVVDRGFFGLDHVDHRAEVIDGDILDFDSDWLKDVDAVVHLAGLSNDPMAAFSPRLNFMLNAAGAAIVAHATKMAGIGRFVFGSTCSVYGTDDDEAVDENRPVRPPYPYAISKLMAERMLICLSDDTFRPIVLRKGTVVGWSPRMRFDLVTNAMVKSALTDQKIVIHNPSLWRPLLDVEDAARAYVAALEADARVTGIFNIAARNYNLQELAETVASALSEFGLGIRLEIEWQQGLRSYRVLTDKAEAVLHFRATKTMAATVREIMEHLIAGNLTRLDDPRYYNIRQMERLMAQGILQENHNLGRAAAFAALV
jgi:nucleoside-diphosphate-sugar epimerase